MTRVEILEVSQQAPPLPRLLGGHLDLPRPGDCPAPAAAVELTSGAEAFRRLPLGGGRPDLAAAFPGVPGAAAAGFRAAVALAGPGEQEWGVRAVLRDQARVPLGRVRARRGGAAGP